MAYSAKTEGCGTCVGVLLDDARVNKVRRAIYAVTFVTCVIIFARLLLTLLVINPAELQPDIIAATG